MFLTSLLFFSYVVKPVHVLVVHHNWASQIHVASDHDELSTPNRHDCSICQFEFCSYIPQDFTEIPFVAFTFSQELISAVPDGILYYSAYTFSLRGPPVV